MGYAVFLFLSGGKLTQRERILGRNAVKGGRETKNNRTLEFRDVALQISMSDPTRGSVQSPTQFSIDAETLVCML